MDRRYRARIDWNYYLIFLLTYVFGAITGGIVGAIFVLGFVL